MGINVKSCGFMFMLIHFCFASLVQSSLFDEDEGVSMLQYRKVPGGVVHTVNQSSLLLAAATGVKQRNCRPIPPIMFLKTHKTGGSTVANILHQMVDCRRMRVMLPQDNIFLGWPWSFPGRDNALKMGPAAHQFDAIMNHAVLNASLAQEYLKPHPFFVTVVREPVEQVISSKNYFHQEASWDFFLHRSAVDTDLSTLFHRNPQALDLGWYDFVGGSTDFDTNQSKIDEWITTLDNYFNSSIITEYMDEGLVLLSHQLQVDLEEMTYVKMKDNTKNKVLPSESQRRQIAALNAVDSALYAHWNRSFWQKWTSGNMSQLHSDLVKLRRLNEELSDACHRHDVGACPPNVTADSLEYTRYLREKQREI